MISSYIVNYQKKHSRLINELLKRLWNAGIELHPDKSSFGLSKVQYLVYEIGPFGFRPIKSKVEAIMKTAVPRNKTVKEKKL